MKKFSSISLIYAVAVLVVTTVSFADASLSSWAFLAELTVAARSPGIYSVTIPLQVMDKSREDLADLRLTDADGHEIPYALRIRRESSERRQFEARAFNQSKVGTISEMSVDLGENPSEHNQAEIETDGSNFRRRVEVEGSDSGKEWRMLKTGDAIFRFQSQNRTVESNLVSYPPSRYRFLRIRVFADEVTDKAAPPITQVRVSMSTHEKGELTTWTASVSPYQLLRSQGAPASSWTIDLGFTVPCDRLLLNVGEPSFSRPFQLEAIDDPQSPRLVAAGELTRRLGGPREPLAISFDHEEHARKLRLVITDYSNQTLSISSIEAAAPARQLVFELRNPASTLLRLFFGNPKATEPRYDFEKDLPAKLSASPNAAVAFIQGEVGAVSSNPDYKPEPLALTERAPWLIYFVLAASSIALALILISLAKATLRSEQQQPKAEARTEDV